MGVAHAGLLHGGGLGGGFGGGLGGGIGGGLEGGIGYGGGGGYGKEIVEIAVSWYFCYSIILKYFPNIFSIFY